MAAFRAKLGMSQRELAQRAGLSPGAIAMIELGQRQPSMTAARRIATAVGGTIDEIFLPQEEGAEAERGRRRRSTPQSACRALSGV